MFADVAAGEVHGLAHPLAVAIQSAEMKAEWEYECFGKGPSAHCSMDWERVFTCARTLSSAGPRRIWPAGDAVCSVDECCAPV